MSKVSVIIPVFNGERYIGNAIRSVFKQSYSDFEIVVVDDGSTDQTAEIVQALGEKVVYRRQSNAGPIVARNLGVASSSGKFVAFLDHDDLWHPDKLEKQVSILDRHSDIGLVCSEVNNIDEEEKPIHRKTWGQRRKIKGDLVGDLHALLNRRFPVAVPSTWLIRRSLLERVGSFDATLPFGGYGELDFFAKLAEFSKICFMTTPLVEYRVRQSGITREKEAEMYANYILVLDKLWQRWKDQPDRRALLLGLYGRYWFKKGREYLKAGDFSSAARFLKTAIRFRPFYIRPWLSLFRLYLTKQIAHPG